MKGPHAATCYALVALGLIAPMQARVRPAGAETVQCVPLTGLPATITAEGVYCLTTDFTVSLASGKAITIAASNVVLDLNGRTIDNLAAGADTTAVGVYAAQRQNIVVRNGTVTGFQVGIHLEDLLPYATPAGHIVEDIRANRNLGVGIWVQGRGNLVRRNRVLAAGGVVGGIGIAAIGPGNRVIDNDVIGASASGSTTAFGILFDALTDGMAVNNRISDANVGLFMSISAVKYRDNLTTASPTPYFGGTDAGNNH
jgi:hypothetical protein